MARRMTGTKKRGGHYREVAVGGGSTVFTHNERISTCKL